MTAIQLGRLDVEIVIDERSEATGGMCARVVLTGRMDDSSPVSDLASKLPAGDVTVDTSGVTFVNSIGMREWLRLLRALRGRGKVTLERVADVLITQMNLMAELPSSVRVVSFHAQYACPACGAEAALLIDAIAHAAELRAMKAPQLPCPECPAAMDLADFPERYLTMFRGT